MSKRKVQFADPELGEELQGGGSQAVQKEQNRRFKEKHSLDSDEEDEEKEERMDEEDIEGAIKSHWVSLSVWFTDVSHPYSSLPIHVRYLYLFATNVFPTCTLSLPVIFATRHNISQPDSGKNIGIILKLNGGDMTYSQHSLSRSRKDPLNHFEISVLRHIRYAETRKLPNEQPNFTNELSPLVRNIC